MQPPCLKPGLPMNHCAARLYQEKVLGHVDLTGDWAGWRLRGRDLIAPDGTRINPRALHGLLFRWTNEQRVARARARERGQQGEVRQLRAGLHDALAAAGAESSG
jgi:hypothetical protein